MRFFEILTVPTYVTKAVSPLGKLTKVFTVAITVVKHDKECTIWSVAPVSITQSELLKAFLSTILVEKTECFRLGTRGILEFIPDMKTALVLRLGEVEVEVPTTSDVIPVGPSTPVYMQEELTLAQYIKAGLSCGMCKSLNKYNNQVISQVVVAIDLYSASAKDLETTSGEVVTLFLVHN